MRSQKILLAGLVFFAASTAQAESYEFKVHNKTDNNIVSLLLSEDGKTWGKFNIGSGIGAGEIATMKWDESTNDQDCKQKVKVIYDDKSESEVTSFDFCESDLELEFE